MSDIPMFDLGSLMRDQQEQLERQRQINAQELQNETTRAAVTIAANEQVRAVNDQSQQSAAAARDQRLHILGGVEEELRRAEVAINLSRSDNPIDRLQLWALQQSSKSYTRAGNSERLAYYTQAANTVGYAEELRQAGFADRIQAIQSDAAAVMERPDAELSLLKLTQQQGETLIQATIANQQNALTYVTQNNDLQQAVMGQLTDEQMQQAIDEARRSPDSTVSANGVQLRLPQLEQHNVARTERKFLTEIRGQQLDAYQLESMTRDQLNPYVTEAQNSPDGVAMIQGRPIPLARLQARIMDLDSMDVQSLQNDVARMTSIRALDQNLQRRILETFEPARLNDIIANGGVDAETGEYFDMDVVRPVRDTKADAVQRQLSDQVMMSTLSDPVTPAAQHSQYLESIKAEPGTMLAQSIQQHQSLMGVAAQFINSGNPQQVRTGQELIASSRETVDQLISQEAERLSLGNANRARALEYQMRGMPIPADLIRQGLMDAKTGTKKQPVSTWLPSHLANEFETVYQDQLRALNAFVDAEGNPNLVNMTAAEKNDAAINAAISAVMDDVAQGITLEFTQFQVELPNHPLHGIMTGGELVTMTHEADRLGGEAYRARTGISQEELAGLMQTGGNPDLAAFQYANLLTLMDQKQPGLADKYIEWWDSPDRMNAVSQYDRWKSEQGSRTLQDLAAWSLVREDLPGQFETNAIFLRQGRQVGQEESIRLQFQNYVTFGGRPDAAQAFLLQNDPSLNDVTKQKIMTKLINPLLSQAQQQNMNFEETSVFVERQLGQMQPEDSESRALLRQLLVNREQSLNILNNFLVPPNPFAESGSSEMNWSGRMDQRLEQHQTLNSAPQYGWFTTMGAQ